MKPGDLVRIIPVKGNDIQKFAWFETVTERYDPRTHPVPVHFPVGTHAIILGVDECTHGMWGLDRNVTLLIGGQKCFANRENIQVVNEFEKDYNETGSKK